MALILESHLTDAFYTPDSIAATMVQAADSGFDGRPANIADFAAGDGALLVAAERRWPEARFTAREIDELAVARLQRSRPAWNVSCQDFGHLLAADDLSIERQDLILLNPPFSYRGGRSVGFEIAGDRMRTSPAMAFVLGATRYLQPHGTIVAVMPQSSVTSHRDDGAREWLSAIGSLEFLHELPRGSFAGTAGCTVIARFERSARIGVSSDPTTTDVLPRLRVRELSRGVVPMHSALDRPPDFALAHTTNLSGGALTLGELRSSSNRPLDGPAVLIPRVGSPNLGKVVAVDLKSPVVLSDCVFALRTDSLDSAVEVRRRIVGSWDRFERAYLATCAPYITASRLAHLLDLVGISIDSSSASSSGR